MFPLGEIKKVSDKGSTTRLGMAEKEGWKMTPWRKSKENRKVVYPSENE